MSLIEAQATGLPCVCSDVIPDEAMLTNLVVKISLSAEISEWAEKCLSLIQSCRGSQTEKIREANYDIRQVVEQLRGIYEH